MSGRMKCCIVIQILHTLSNIQATDIFLSMCVLTTNGVYCFIYSLGTLMHIAGVSMSGCEGKNTM
jgi:hypothetical protein